MLFTEGELEASGSDLELREFFQKVDENSSPLTDELLKAIDSRARELQRIATEDHDRRDAFLKTTGIKQWRGLLHVSKKSARENQKELFLKEWFSTLQILRYRNDDF